MSCPRSCGYPRLRIFTWESTEKTPIRPPHPCIRTSYVCEKCGRTPLSLYRESWAESLISDAIPPQASLHSRKRKRLESGVSYSTGVRRYDVTSESYKSTGMMTSGVILHSLGEMDADLEWETGSRHTQTGLRELHVVFHPIQ